MSNKVAYIYGIMVHLKYTSSDKLLDILLCMIIYLEIITWYCTRDIIHNKHTLSGNFTRAYLIQMLRYRPGTTPGISSSQHTLSWHSTSKWWSVPIRMTSALLSMIQLTICSPRSKMDRRAQKTTPF